MQYLYLILTIVVIQETTELNPDILKYDEWIKDAETRVKRLKADEKRRSEYEMNKDTYIHDKRESNYAINPTVPKKLPIGITDIREILEGDYVYVDKTSYIYELIMRHEYDLFMVRPPGFGKTLFLSTLAEIFKGNKKLFEGTAIHNCTYTWMPFPILHFDFSQMDSRNFEASLKKELKKMEKVNGVEPTAGKTVKSQLGHLVEELSNKTHNRVVVLIDEYDSPVIKSINRDLKSLYDTRNVLEKFISALTSLSDKYLQFIFVTGVNQFSICGPKGCGHDHLVDITLNPRYATMMGFTRDELETYFVDYARPVERWDEIQTLHNGYIFSDSNNSVFSPFSVLYHMSNKDIESSSIVGERLPHFLIESVRKDPQILFDLGNSATEGFPLKTPIDVAKRIDLQPFLFQTGYLTICGYEEHDDYGYYKLDFRNEHARRDFFGSFLEGFAQLDSHEVSLDSEKMKQYLSSLNIGAFIDKMRDHISKIPIEIRQNATLPNFQTIFYLLLENFGLKTKVEFDCTRIEIPSVLVNCHFQFTVDHAAETALELAVESYKKRITRDKKTFCVGITFDSGSHNIQDWKAELYEGEKIVEHKN